MSEEAEIIDTESKTPGLTVFRSASVMIFKNYELEILNFAFHIVTWIIE